MFVCSLGYSWLPLYGQKHIRKIYRALWFPRCKNMDGIVESSHKNAIYCITQNVIEFGHFLMDKSKVGQY